MRCASPCSAVSIPSSRNRPFGRHPPCSGPLARRPVSIPSSRNRPFGRNGNGWPCGAACGLNPLIEESSIRTTVCSLVYASPYVSIPSSRNRPFGHELRLALGRRLLWLSQSPHRGIVHSDTNSHEHRRNPRAWSQSPHRGIVHSDPSRPACSARRAAGVSIPSSRNRPFGPTRRSLTPYARPSLNPLIEESSIRTEHRDRQPGARRRLNPLIEESSIRTTANQGNGLSSQCLNPLIEESSIRTDILGHSPSPRPLRLNPLIEESSIRTMTSSYMSPTASGLNPLIEESSIRTSRAHGAFPEVEARLNPLIEESSIRTATHQCRRQRYRDVSIPSSRNRPFGLSKVPGPTEAERKASQSPHRGIVHSDSRRGGRTSANASRLNPLIEESSIRTWIRACQRKTSMKSSQSPHRGIVHSDAKRRACAPSPPLSLNPLIEESSIRTTRAPRSVRTAASLNPLIEESSIRTRRGRVAS